jgi:hypothetical protein
MLYIRLFHGRTHPDQEMDDWGSDGPVFGPYRYVHTTYRFHVKLGRPDDDCDELMCYEDMLYYDGVYYGDWSVFEESVIEKSGLTVSSFEQGKANLPKQPQS